MIQEATGATLGGNAEITSFSIEMNEVMFSMLSSNVYTDKILASIREPSTNAVDACIAAGKPVRFKVHVPTILEPYFSVRDYGTGLSDEDIKSLYSTLGASTKRASNAFNGVYGIGRLSPLAYTGMFQVTSYQNSIKTVYAITTESGIPKTATLGHSKTDVEDGLEVSWNVNPKDINKYVSTVQDTFKWFDQKPETNIPIEYGEPTKIVEGSDWYLEEVPYHNQDRLSGGPAIIMGNVAYTVPKGLLDDYTGKNRSVMNALLGTNIRIFAPIGAVSFTPSREVLSMTPKTTEYVLETFERVSNEFSEKALAPLKSISCNFEKAKKHQEIERSLDWRLRSILRHESPFNDGQGYINSDTVSKLPEGISLVVYERSRSKAEDVGGSNYRASAVQPNSAFMVADTPTLHTQSVAEYRAQNPDAGGYHSRQVFMLRATKRVRKDKMDEYNKKIQEALKLLGVEKYELTSTYAPAKAPKVATSKNTRKAVPKEFTPIVYSISAEHSWLRSWRHHRTISNVLAERKDTLIVYIKHSASERSDTTEHLLEKLNVLAYMRDAYSEKIIVIGVPKYAHDYVETSDDFVSVDEAYTAMMKKHKVYTKPKTQTCNMDIVRCLSKISIIDKLPKTSKFRKIYEELKKQNHTASNVTIRSEALSALNIKIKERKLRSVKSDAEFDKLYPLIGTLRYAPNDKILHYIQLEEKCRRKGKI